MFAEYNKREFVQTAVGATGFIIVSYLTMLGLLLIIS